MTWSPSAAQPVLAFERTSVYLLALLAVLLVSTRRESAAGLVGGVLAGTVVLCGYGLYTYAGDVRLSEPIGYSNGVGMLAVVGLLVAIGLAANADDRRARVLAFGAVPLLAATLYLTFSRGSWLALGAGVCVAVMVDARRLHLLAVLALALPAPALVVWLVAARPTGPQLGVAVVTCSAVALGIGWALPDLERHVRVSARGRRAAGAILVLGVAAVFVGAVAVAGGPAEIAARTHRSFSRQLPATGSDLDRRLFSASGNGRADVLARRTGRGRRPPVARRRRRELRALLGAPARDRLRDAERAQPLPGDAGGARAGGPRIAAGGLCRPVRCRAPGARQTRDDGRCRRIRSVRGARRRRLGLPAGRSLARRSLLRGCCPGLGARPRAGASQVGPPVARGLARWRRRESWQSSRRSATARWPRAALRSIATIPRRPPGSRGGRSGGSRGRSSRARRSARRSSPTDSSPPRGRASDGR